MSKRIFIACLSFLVFSFGEIFAQGEPIYLSNPSFEDFARPSHPPRGWYDCGEVNFPLETPPDVHPSGEVEPAFGVSTSANDGDTYLGLVVRENDSYESVAQRLSAPLQAGQCYSFSIFIATSKTYKSQIRDSNKEVNFTDPIKLRIRGGNGYCDKSIALAESKIITHPEWIEYSFKFEPKKKVNYIVFEAMYQTPTMVIPNGNILLDNASPIQPIPCDEELPIAKKPEVKITNPSSDKKTVDFMTFEVIAKVMNIDEKRKISLNVNGKNERDFTYNPSNNKFAANLELKEGINKVSIKAANSAGNASDETVIIYKPQVQNPVAKVDSKPPSQIVKDLESLAEGETIRVDELFFKVDSYKITKVSKPVLEDIFQFLQNNPKVSVEIGGHTNRNCDTEYCQTLSTNRAKAVVDYLIEKGIRSNRLTYRGYGKTKPITFSQNAEMQKKNQRVEIKILSIGS